MNEENYRVKALRLEYNEIVCLHCNSVLTLPEELEGEEFVRCVKCDAAIANPLCKILTCGYCLSEGLLPIGGENALMVDCGECGETIYNIYSDQYTPVVCPYCSYESHLPAEGWQANYLSCPNCLGEFRPPLL